MSNLADYFPGESILLEQSGWWVKSFFNVKTGTIVLTDKRIAFVEQKQIVGGGLVAKAAGAALGVVHPKLEVDVAFDELKQWTRPKKVDILVENQQGESFKLRGPGKEWDAKLAELASV